MSKSELRKIVSKINSSYSQDSYYNLIGEYNTLLETMIDNGFREELDEDAWIGVMDITPKYLDVLELILEDEAKKTSLIFETLSISNNLKVFYKMIIRAYPGIEFYWNAFKSKV